MCMREIKGKVDLHVHTTASDGTWEPEKIIEVAKARGIGLIAVTDHDEIANVEKTKVLAKKKDIAFLTGVEISSTLEGELYHILGYGIDVNNSELKNILRNNSYLLEEKDNDAIRMLIKHGYDINYDEFEKYEHDPRRGGWKALNYLIDKGLCTDVKDFFGRLFIDEYSIDFPVFPHPIDIIKVIKNAGGIPVLAHPYYSGYDITLKNRLNDFIEFGVEGIECYHPNHSKEAIEYCINFCKHRELITTSGSDCHGDFIKTRRIGEPEVHINQINLGKLINYVV